VRPVAIVGHLARDRIAGGPPRVGGGAYHCARALRLLGREAVVVTKIPPAERYLLDGLVRLGVPVRFAPAESMPGFGIDYDGDVRTMTVDALGDPWTPEEARGWVADALRGVEWVHIAPLGRSDFPADALAALARGRRLSLDGQGLVRAPVVGPLTVDADYDPDVLRHISILKLSEEEAAVVVGGTDERALRALGVPEVIVTLGPRGSIVYADDLAEHVPARPIDCDPTGAGDFYGAAYLAARASGAAPVAAARRATAVARELLAGRG
jgi:sugar/nucleoside kinase (ribokinase family)